MQVFCKIENHCNITEEQRKFISNYIKTFLCSYISNKWTRSYTVIDLKETAINILGFDIGTRDFMIEMHKLNFPLRPATEKKLIGYYKVKSNYYDLARKIDNQLKKSNLKIEIKENKVINDLKHVDNVDKMLINQ